MKQIESNSERKEFNTFDTNELTMSKLKKRQNLLDKGINPYPYRYYNSHYSTDIIENFECFDENKKVQISGRIMNFRKMGKASFWTMFDYKGKIQVYIKKDNVGDEQYNLLDQIDIGDIVGVEGFVFKTRTGEISVNTTKITILTKSTGILPEKYHGITDPDFKYRHRSLDLLMNPDTKKRFICRSKAMQAIRQFFSQHDFLEMEVPVLDTKYGGGEAKPFTTEVNALGCEAYLKVSPELYLKRLMVGGLDRVYTIDKSFRNEGIDKTHYPEFTLMEAYCAYADYYDIMELTENLYEFVFQSVLGKTKIIYNDFNLDFKAPWKRVRMVDIIKERTKVTTEFSTKKEIISQMNKLSISLPNFDLENATKGEIIIELYEIYCEKSIIEPTFIYDYPKDSSPLCKPHRDNPEFIERFEAFVAEGIELGNAYSELNDPVFQKRLLEDQAEKLRGGLETASPIDYEFVYAAEVGMPPAGGVGLGIDRLIMLLTNAYSIKEVIAFPIMKR